MKIGVISDTHIPVRASAIPEKVLQSFAGTDLILHAGDLVDLAVIEELKRIAPVEAVCGNLDPPEVREILTKRRIIKVGNFKIGLIHGSGSPFGLIERVKREFGEEKLDIIIFGHSHSPCKKIIDNTIFFNPGSPTDRFFTSVNTLGILDISDRITTEIIRL